MDIKSMIDHTILKPDAKKDEIQALCQEAKEFGFYAVCVNPYYVSLCKDLLEGSKVKIATVIGFPLGANTSDIKALETKKAIDDGADEIDMVINIGALKDGDYGVVRDDIKAVVEAAKDRARVKVIIETSVLTDDEKIKACELSLEAGADFVKTSTGFSTGGATVEDVKLMKSVVKDKMEIKASGGVRDFETARKMIEAGARRIGTSSGVKIVKGK